MKKFEGLKNRGNEIHEKKIRREINLWDEKFMTRNIHGVKRSRCEILRSEKLVARNIREVEKSRKEKFPV